MRGPIKLIDVNNNNAFSLYIDDIDSLRLIKLHQHDPKIAAVIDKYVQADSIAVDVGAMIGYFTVIMSSRASVVHAIEPDPANFSLLSANVTINNLNNVHLYNVAALDSERTVCLYRNARNHGDHRLFDAGHGSVSVKAKKLDDIITPPIDFMKIDTQGAELAVLKGAANIIASSPALIMTVEFAPWWLHGFGTDPCDLLDFLRWRFTIHSLDGKPYSDVELLESYPVDKQAFTDLLCVRRCDAKILA